MALVAGRDQNPRMRTTTVLPRRQRWRRSLLNTSLLFFPVTMYYMSPVLSLMGAANNIVAGSVIVFAIQLLSAIFVGRAFCGWVCPAGAVQEIFTSVQPKPLASRWVRWSKWVIWVPWLGFLLYMLFSGRGSLSVDFDAFTRGGISLTDLSGYVVYYLVLTVFLVLALTLGRRGGCHAICWMSPFMIVGRSIRNLFRLPALSLRSAHGSCIACGVCTEHCPMSIDVQALVQSGTMEHTDCMLCGECVDGCPKKVISYAVARESLATSR